MTVYVLLDFQCPFMILLDFQCPFMILLDYQCPLICRDHRFARLYLPDHLLSQHVKQTALVQRCFNVIPTSWTFADLSQYYVFSG